MGFFSGLNAALEATKIALDETNKKLDNYNAGHDLRIAKLEQENELEIEKKKMEFINKFGQNAYDEVMNKKD